MRSQTDSDSRDLNGVTFVERWARHGWREISAGAESSASTRDEAS